MVCHNIDENSSTVLGAIPSITEWLEALQQSPDTIQVGKLQSTGDNKWKVRARLHIDGRENTVEYLFEKQ